MEKEFYFETDDRLDRKKYAEFLKTLLEHCDEYRREDSDGAYVIAIDSPWGTGKTRFAKMLRNFLEGREPEIVYGVLNPSVVPEPNEDRLFNVIYYNSWETDYWGDALEPLINSIFESQLLEVEGAEADNAKLKDAIVRILKGMGLALIKLALGDAASSVFQGAIDGLNDVPDDPLAALKSKASQYSEFKSALGSVIARTNKKLVIIVDELDRCRPTFAIETLEIVKHLFDVPGLMFVFALDIRQLSCSIETVYGQRMDAQGYLCRFFDYIGQMQTHDESTFINLSLINENYFSKYPFNQIVNDVACYIDEVSKCYRMSLRDISTVIQTYKIMLSAFLDKYELLEAHKIYIALLVIKYKDIEFYNELLQAESNSDLNINGIFKTDKRRNLLSLCDTLSKVLLISKMQDYEYSLVQNSKVSSTSGIKIVCVDDSMIQGKVKVTYSFKGSEGRVRMQNVFLFDGRTSLNDVIFLPDVFKWDRISYMPLRRYYFQQLEMFNFALPSE